MTKNNIKELSIQVNLNGLSFCILNRTSNTIEYINHIAFQQKLTPFDVLNRLKTELSANTIYSDQFKAVTLIHQNDLATLVPKTLFDEKHKVDYLKFNAKILKTDFISHDELEINDTVNVYVPYVNINNYIFEIFGEFTYKHSSTLLIDTTLQRKNQSNSENVFINVNPNTLELLVVKNNHLELYNSFEYYSKEDFIYYVLFVFEQLNLDVENTPIQLTGHINEHDELFHIIYTYVRHVKLLETNIVYNFSSDIDQSQKHKYYLILNSF